MLTVRARRKPVRLSEKKAGGHLEFFPGKEAQTQGRTQEKKATKNKAIWVESHLPKITE